MFGLEQPVKKNFANVTASSTDSSLVSAVTGMIIRVHAVFFMDNATGTAVTFNSKGSGAGTAISATFNVAANGGAVMGFNPAGWFDTNPGEALTVTTGAGSTTGIQFNYTEVAR